MNCHWGISVGGNEYVPLDLVRLAEKAFGPTFVPREQK